MVSNFLNSLLQSRAKLLLNLRGDLSGALAAAIVTLPMSIGYGIVAFAPLGAEFAPKAALLGIYSAVLSGLLAGLAGGTPVQISGPKAPLTLVLGSLMAGMSAKLAILPKATPLPEILIGLAAFCVIIAGLCQITLGFIGAGNLVKYVPQSVIAGFMNGIAVLLIIQQIPPILGMPGGTPLVHILHHAELINPLAVAVGLVTITSNFMARKHLKRIPASLAALGVGSAFYYGLSNVVSDKLTGRLVGHLDPGLPTPDAIFHLLPALEPISYRALLPELLATGLIIGLLASMESLLASVVSDNLTGSRHNSKKELIGQGLGNMACGLFGALPAAGSVPRSMVNYKAGGRTRASGLLCTAIIFLMLVFLAPVIGKMPLPVVAGIIVVVGVSLFDRWSLNLLKRGVIFFRFDKELFSDLIITLVVTIVTVSINLIAAVAVGIVLASALFIARMGRSIIKRKFLGSQFRSRKMRHLEHMEALERTGDRIVIIELQGPLFFGSAENLAFEIQTMVPQTHYCILDFERVNDIDSTGAYIISHIKKMLEGADIYLLLSHLKENQPLWNFLEVIYPGELIENCFIFPNIDAALEWAEDHLLDQIQEAQEPDPKVRLSRFELFRDFSAEELNTLRAKLTLQAYHKGQPVFDEGDEGRDLYLLTKGAMSVQIHLHGKNRHKRLYTYTSGTVLGEVAFLDGSRRSASVWAHEDSEALCLSFNQFKTLRTESPEIAAKLATNLSLVLCGRLRRLSNQVRLLEES